ncbi:MAG: penicillin-binding protein activator, partial [Holosporaceae bacterium]|nr:penicillin-binding protein activator [Holosporaceae bacterium]
MKIFLLICLASCSPSKDTLQPTITTPQKAIDELSDPYLKDSFKNCARDSILLLLPISGSNAQLGKSILNACVLSSKEANEENIDFHVVDTADLSIEKFKLYDKFKQKNLKAIIGPVFFQETKRYGALFPNVPILSLSNNLDVNSNHIIACGLSPQHEISNLFEFAISQKISSFVAILPEGDFGNQILDYIKNEAKKHGLEDNVEIIRYTSIAREDATKYAKNSGKKAIFVIDPIL